MNVIKIHIPKPLKSLEKGLLLTYSNYSSEQKEINLVEYDSSLENFKDELNNLQRQREIQEELLSILNSWKANTKQNNYPPRVSNIPHKTN
jgi:hypothetical protein